MVAINYDAEPGRPDVMTDPLLMALCRGADTAPSRPQPAAGVPVCGRYGPTHSQSLEKLFLGMPRLAPGPGRGQSARAVLFSSATSMWSISGTPFIAARALAAAPLLVAAAFTCMSRTSQYPLGSAQAGIGWRAARATAGLAFSSATVSTWASLAVPAELTAVRAAISPFPCPSAHERYC